MHTKGAESKKQDELGAETFQAALPRLHAPQDGVRPKLEAPDVAEPRRVDAALRHGAKNSLFCCCPDSRNSVTLARGV